MVRRSAESPWITLFAVSLGGPSVPVRSMNAKHAQIACCGTVLALPRAGLKQADGPFADDGRVIFGVDLERAFVPDPTFGLCLLHVRLAA